MLYFANKRFQTAVMCVNTWFLKKRGLAMGIALSGASFGGISFPVILNRLFSTVGFPWALRATAFVILGLLLIANFLVKSRLPPPGWRRSHRIFEYEALTDPVFCLVVVSPQ